MKRWKGLIGIMVLSLAVSGCGEKGENVEKEDEQSDKYYANTPLEKFETFTSITGIEVSGVQESEGGTGTIYTYIFDNDAAGMSAMLKYDTYIKEYGFVEGESNGTGMTFFEKDDTYDILISMSQPQESVIQYIVIVPHMTMAERDAVNEQNKEAEQAAMESKREEDYANFVELCQNRKYQEAKDFFNESDLWYNDDEGYRRHYKDSMAYYDYCNGMLCYAEGKYGEAVSEFSKCENSVLDLDKVKADILSEINSLNGTYQITDTWSGHKSITINNGKVGTEIEVDSWPSSSRYGKYIVKMSNGSFGIGAYSGIDYIITLNGSTLTVEKAPGASYDTFAGEYKRVSSGALKEQ